MVVMMVLLWGMVWEKFVVKRLGFGFVKEFVFKGDVYVWCWES